MPSIPFAKYHGLGNDFILVDARRTRAFVGADATRRLCDRRRGIGADGVITLLPARQANAALRMHIQNADGSVAEMCGNGLRCVVAWALAGTSEKKLIVDTDAGLREGTILPDGRVRVTLGTSKLIADPIDAIAGDFQRKAIGISMGNPHLVLAPFDASEDLRGHANKLGPTFERHPQFPQRTNVGFIAPTGPRSLRVVVFERGAGITDACGTGAGAAVVAAKRWGLFREVDTVRVALPGGELDVELSGDAVAIVGDANHAFDGTVLVGDHELRADS